jgi:alpha-L-arabinofuranosidase
MRKVVATLRQDAVIGETDPRLFGAFVEHVGRCVYGGIFEPGHPSADRNGFRQDVLALVRELRPSIVRYPGGNFVSGYRWEDGVGPVDKRPRRLDLAWWSTETNRFGTNEFIDWCRLADVEPMLAVNLGTRRAESARNLLEYCNHPQGTAWSDLRREHGWPQAHGVKLWCLGNEMDAPWQMETKTAQEYGRIAAEAAKLMKWTQPDIELAGCGSSGRNMPSFGAWEETVLQHAFEHVDYISLHTYLNNWAQDTPAFLGSSDLMDAFIDEVAAITDAVAARKHSSKRIMLSFDEWNVWYRTRGNANGGRAHPGWPVAPALLEEVYTMEDALAFGGACISLLNHADRVKVACLAQLVNAIAPIMTETGGPAWRQTIFHPFAQMSRFARGRVLRAEVDSPAYQANYYDPVAGADLYFPLPSVPYLKFAAVEDSATGAVTLFALNRNLAEPMNLEVNLQAYETPLIVDAQQLRHDDLQACNTRERPERVTPAALEAETVGMNRVRATLAPASWNMIRLGRT